MINPVDRVARAIARRNSFALVWAQFLIAHLVILGGLGPLALYQPMSTKDFLILVAVSQALVRVDNLVSTKLTMRMWRPVRRWELGVRDELSTIAAWEALATLPTERVRRGDYRHRVPVASTGEIGRLAHSSNTMVEGLDERDRDPTEVVALLNDLWALV